MEHFYFGSGLIYFSTVFSRFIHCKCQALPLKQKKSEGTASSCFVAPAPQFPFSWLPRGDFPSSPTLATMNNATVAPGVQVSFPMGMYPTERLVDHMLTPLLIFLRQLHTASCKGCSSLHFLLRWRGLLLAQEADGPVAWVFDETLSNQREARLIVIRVGNSPIVRNAKYSFTTLLKIFMSLLKTKCLFRSFPPHLFRLFIHIFCPCVVFHYIF